MKLSHKIQAFLFFKGEPTKISLLEKQLGCSLDEVKAALLELEIESKNTGIVLITNNDEVSLGTNPEVSKLIEDATKEELSKDLGRAGLETLSLIMYYGPISRKDIDYIRGVNSAYIIRNLLIRGLIEREEDKRDSRIYLYKGTLDMLRFMGISNIESLPDYKSTRAKFEEYKQSLKNDSNSSESNEQ
jgi:segregation and condensation protein B